MVKKLLILVIILLLILGGWSLMAAYQNRQTLKQQRAKAKAPEISVTFVEGWTNKQIAGYLQDNSIVDSQTFLTAVKDFDISGYPLLADKPKNSGLEGYIFPDTYFLPKDYASGSQISELIITKALDNFSEKITPQIQAEATANGLTLYQLLTMASILEKETKGDATERATVAGILYNRLKAGIPLQVDSTIGYVTGKTSVSSQDITIDNPYNTYKYAGLPPGPICNPSLISITAAANPIQTDYLYFLTDPSTGRAVFAKTYDEHLANIQKYLK